jgi:cyclomaltodextrinase / maltogenic alpha-amylase / neopullulanase
MKRHLNLVGVITISVVFIVLFNSCKNRISTNQGSQNNSTTDTSSEFKVSYKDFTGWTYNQNIYEVNIRQYTDSGTFKAFEEHLPRLQQMGVGILWLMPINPIGIVNRNQPLGSYYSVMDYSTVNPEFGTMDDFKSLVKDIHQKGMHVMVDWVANHTSCDNILTKTHPEYYLRDSTGKFLPPPGHEEWTDVIQLDYSKPELQAWMIDMLKKWVIETGIDGFRFDYVDGVPSEFWKKTIAELKKLKPDIFLLAEGSNVKYHEMGFDMDYCWPLQGWNVGIMRQIYEGKKKVYDLDNFLNAEKTNYISHNYYHMLFTSTHDENSWHGDEYEQLGASSEVFAVLTQTLYGMPLIYNGQEAGLNRRLKFFDKDVIQWDKLPHQEFYSTFNHLRDTCHALWNGNAGGAPVRITTTNDQSVFAFSRSKNSSKVLVLLNLTNKPVKFKISNNEQNGKYFDVFTKKSEEINNQRPITLKPWGYMVLVK